MRRLTVSSIFPRGDSLEEEDEEEVEREESHLNVSFHTHHLCSGV